MESDLTSKTPPSLKTSDVIEVTSVLTVRTIYKQFIYLTSVKGVSDLLVVDLEEEENSCLRVSNCVIYIQPALYFR